ncbi:transposase [Amycolatopsis sp. cmx-8-4]|uniref:transposase n=1 Tax=Amycolatopsis sp. cmx-8-4 TaxID=2790947 RepID=UPI0039788772
MLGLLEGRALAEPVAQAVRLLATVLGQDLTDDGGVFRIARKVAADRVISTVDPAARHGHKTSARGFDGYKGHIAIDPDAEIITATEVTPGNSGDAEVAGDLLADILPSEAEAEAEAGGQAAVYGDAAYGAGELLAQLDNNNVHNGLKVQPSSRVKGHFSKDDFGIDPDAETVTCPAGNTVAFRVRNGGRHAAKAEFGAACATCPLASQCTDAKAGRSITIGHYEAFLAAGRARQADPVWKADYRATRPKVERKIGHLMRRRHGGRRARVRGLTKTAADFSLLAAAVNLARLATLAVTSTARGWATTTA